MNILESAWLGQRLASLSSDELFPMLKVGCSTEDYRTVEQPWIDANIFAPLRKRGGKIIHLDMKEARGVDIVGDLLDPKFLDRLGHITVRSVMASSLFQYVTNRQELTDVLLKIVQPGGYFFVTGPQNNPYCPDPIATSFRPTLETLHTSFPAVCVSHSTA